MYIILLMVEGWRDEIEMVEVSKNITEEGLKEILKKYDIDSKTVDSFKLKPVVKKKGSNETKIEIYNKDDELYHYNYFICRKVKLDKMKGENLL